MRIITCIFCFILWFSTSLGMQFPSEDISHSVTGDKYILTAFKSHTDPDIVTTMIRNTSTDEVLDNVSLNIETLSSDFTKLTNEGHFSWIEIQRKQNGETVFHIKDKFAEGIQADSWNLMFDGYSIIYSGDFPPPIQANNVNFL
ncbi:MAG: hypothetical protein IJT36_00600 [Alphaproteobacteria bacterium]|nr:hypothetical protein [Alphaproteobacteria bacterium]